MTKDEWIWVAIRIFGMYMLILAVMAIPEAIGHVYAAIQLASVPKGAADSNELTKMAISIRDAQFGQGIKAVTQALLFSIFSFYLLKHGKLIHKIASSENA